MIPAKTIEQIFDTVRVEEVIGDFISLKKRGVNLLGLCPFHNEKTPSFTVSPAKGIYKCFGCGKGGKAVNFIMDHEQLSYPEALRYLAKKYNIEIEEEELTPEQIKANNERESLHLINDFAKEYFIDSLNNTDEGRTVGLSYFKERGFRLDTIETFLLGYNPKDEESLTKKALAKGYDITYLQKLGLSKSGSSGYFDFFRGRVIFPIRSISGRVVGFGGRILENNKKIAKYFNSPESEVYNKSKVLYGLYESKSTIAKKDEVLLVEGYTDVISMHQAGVTNVVSSSGTSLTDGQVRLIKRYTQNITVVFDGDQAGLKAAFRGVDMLLEEGLKVKVIPLEEGEDPDTMARKLSQEDLENFIKEKSKDYFQFKTDVLLKESDVDPSKRAGVIREIIQTLALVPDAIDLDLKSVEISRQLNIEQRTLLNELNQIRRKKSQDKVKRSRYQHLNIVEKEQQEAPAKPQIINNPLEIQEKDLMRVLLKYGHLPFEYEAVNEAGEKENISTYAGVFILEDMMSDEFSFVDPHCQNIFKKYLSYYDKGELLTYDSLMMDANAEESSLAAELLMDRHQLHNWEKNGFYIEDEEDQLHRTIHSALNAYKLRKVMLMIKELRAEIQQEKNVENQMLILQKLRNLEYVKTELSAYFGSAII